MKKTIIAMLALCVTVALSSCNGKAAQTATKVIKSVGKNGAKYGDDVARGFIGRKNSSSTATICIRCHGRGYVSYLDNYGYRHENELCALCGGSGKSQRIERP